MQGEGTVTSLYCSLQKMKKCRMSFDSTKPAWRGPTLRVTVYAADVQLVWVGTLKRSQNIPVLENQGAVDFSSSNLR